MVDLLLTIAFWLFIAVIAVYVIIFGLAGIGTLIDGIIDSFKSEQHKQGSHKTES